MSALAVVAFATVSAAFGAAEDILPDGQAFPFWDDETAYSREWHVDARRGDDAVGDGSAARPFKTINKAAARVSAGEKVVIHAGTYRETVDALARGGDGKDRMVAFEAAGDGEVVVSGAAVWNAEFTLSSEYRQTFVSDEAHLFMSDKSAWTSSNANAKVWCGRFPRSMFADGENPFAVPICPTTDWAPFAAKDGRTHAPPSIIARLVERSPQLIPHWLCRRGLLFCDGEMMREVLTPQELWADKTAGEHIYWVADDGREVHFRLRGDASPDGRRFESTVREQGFAPEARGLAYVRISGIVFEKFGNGQMPPQRGAISVSRGHHWIVEKCTVRDVHTVGVDLGVQSHWVAWERPRGFDIIRDCTFERCGVHAVCGVPGNGYSIRNVLVERCRFDGIGWLYSLHGHTESGAVKFHFSDGCLVRRNVFTNLKWGEAVWIDKCVSNNRIAYNVVVDSAFADTAFFVECTCEPNRIDHNAVVRCSGVVFADKLAKGGVARRGGHFCRASETDHTLVDGNFIADIEGALFIDDGRNPEKGRRPREGYPTLQVDERFERNVIVSRGASCELTFPGAGKGNVSRENIFAFPPGAAGEVRFSVFGREGVTSVGRLPDEGSRIAEVAAMSLTGMRLAVKVNLPGGLKILDYEGDISVGEDLDRLMEAIDAR